jgi:hypothetical protein
MSETQVQPPKMVKHTEAYVPPVRNIPLLRRASAEDEERRAREDKIRDLLPEEEADNIGKAYDGRLLARLIAYLGSGVDGDFVAAECGGAVADRAGD